MNRLTLTLIAVLNGTILAYGQTEEKKATGQSTPPAEEIWYEVDVSPSFPGGFAKFYAYLNSNLKYPKDAKKKGIEGKVMVEFVVDSTGLIRPETVNAVQGIFKSCDDEAIRLITKSPQWVPGRVTQLNKNVPVKIVLPVIFKR
jgi:protein TonB